MITAEEYVPEEVKLNEWAHASCDKYDYMAAAFCGATAGIIDILFVGAPGISDLGKITDEGFDTLVKKAASLCGWNPREGKEDSIASAIGYFERHFGVNYDQRSTADVDGVFDMAAKNHHFKSLSHAPDPIGLFFSILDQFTNKSSFLDNGQLIRVDTSSTDFRLEGGNFIAKLFCGFCNWLGHIMSDIAGSSGNRGQGDGRGSGLPAPFMELFGACDFGSFQVGNDRQNLATVMTRVFQKGYDFRFSVTTAIPVIMQDLMIRIFWVIRQHYFEGKPWGDCIPNSKHADLRIMLIVGCATLCLVDGTDAAIRGAMAGGNILVFILHLNYVAWFRLVMLVLKELIIRYGPQIKRALLNLVMNFMQGISLSEQKAICAFYDRMEKYDKKLDALFKEFVAEVEAEYKQFMENLNGTYNVALPTNVRADYSVKLAKDAGVKDSNIIHSNEELDDYIRNNRKF